MVNFVGGFFGSIGKLFSGDDDSLGQGMVRFSKLDIDLIRLQNNIKALKEFNSLRFARQPIGATGGLTSFAEDLAKSVPIIEAAIMGSEEFKWLGQNLKIKGLASGDIKYEQAVKNIRMLRKALGVEVAVPPAAREVAPDIDNAALAKTGGLLFQGRGAAPMIIGGSNIDASSTSFTGQGISARRPVVLSTSVYGGMS